MPPTIMIVDDSPTIRWLARSFLVELGFDFVEAEDGLRALGFAKVQPIQLVIADLRMPNLDGLGLLRALRCGPDLGLRLVPVVLLTMEQDQGIAREALAAGANAFLTKPVTPEALQAVVKRLLALPGAE